MERDVNVRGLFDVHLFEEGTGSEALLWLHGIDGLMQFPSWLTPFATTRRVIAPQFPGVGGSTGMEHLDDFSDLAVFYLDLLDALGIRQAVWMGHDLGANVAAEVAAQCSHAVSKLVLVAPTGLWDDATPVPDVFATNQAVLAGYTWRDPQAARDNGWIPQGPADAEDMRRYFLERNKTMTASAKFLWPIPDKGLRKRIHRVSSPTLLVWGAQDGVVPTAYGKLFQELIPGSKLVVIDEAAHMPMLERSLEFEKAVEGFLR